MVGGAYTETVTYRGVNFTYDAFKKRCKERKIEALIQLLEEYNRAKQQGKQFNPIELQNNKITREELINVIKNGINKKQIYAEQITDRDFFMHKDSPIKLKDFQEFDENNTVITELFKSFLTEPNNFNPNSTDRYASCLDHVYSMPYGSPYLSTSSSFSVSYDYAVQNSTMGDLICIGEYKIPNTDIATDVDEVIAYLEQLEQNINENPDEKTVSQHCFTIPNTSKRVFDIKNIMFQLINNKTKLAIINRIQERINGKTYTTWDDFSKLLHYTFKLREYDLICEPLHYLKKMYIFKMDTFDTMWKYEKDKGYHIGQYGNTIQHKFVFNDIPNYRLFPLLTNNFVSITQPENPPKEEYTIMTLNLRAGLDILGRYSFKDKRAEPALINGESKMTLLVDIILKTNCDIICIQEFGYQQDNFLEIFYEAMNEYNIHYINTYQENIAILVKKEYNTKNEDIGIIPSIMCPTERNYILLRIHSLNITILNVHMCGGATDDKEGSSPDNAKSRDIEFILKLFPKIDIICGDFNGDANIDRYKKKTEEYIKNSMTTLKNGYMSSFIKTVQDQNFMDTLKMIDDKESHHNIWSNVIQIIRDFKTIPKDNKKLLDRESSVSPGAVKLNKFITKLEERMTNDFYDWIYKPFIQLQNNKYIPCSKAHERFITTPYGTQVDYIYYNEDSIVEVRSKLVNLMNIDLEKFEDKKWDYNKLSQDEKYECESKFLSDHNGIITTFKINVKPLPLKSDLNKTQYIVNLSAGPMVIVRPIETVPQTETVQAIGIEQPAETGPSTPLHLLTPVPLVPASDNSGYPSRVS